MGKAPSKGIGSSVAIAAVIVVVLVAAGGFYLLAFPSSNHTTTPPGTTVIPSSGSTIKIPSGTGSNQALNYSPQSIKVVVGVNNTVKWTNADSATHSITFTLAPSGVSSSSLTDPDNLQAGESYSVTLTTPGTYQYHCTFHSWMSGTITVVAA